MMAAVGSAGAYAELVFHTEVTYADGVHNANFQCHLPIHHWIAGPGVRNLDTTASHCVAFGRYGCSLGVDSVASSAC